MHFPSLVLGLCILLFVLFLIYELYLPLCFSLTSLVISHAWPVPPQLLIPKLIFSQNHFPFMSQVGELNLCLLSSFFLSSIKNKLPEINAY